MEKINMGIVKAWKKAGFHMEKTDNSLGFLHTSGVAVEFDSKAKEYSVYSIEPLTEDQTIFVSMEVHMLITLTLIDMGWIEDLRTYNLQDISSPFSLMWNTSDD